eukprot:403332574
MGHREGQQKGIEERAIQENEEYSRGDDQYQDSVLQQLKNEAFNERELRREDSQEGTLKGKKSKKNRDKMLMSIFKSVPRDQQQIYKLIQPTHPLNDGRYNVNYKIIEKNPNSAAFANKTETIAKQAIELKPYCQQKNITNPGDLSTTNNNIVQAEELNLTNANDGKQSVNFHHQSFIQPPQESPLLVHQDFSRKETFKQILHSHLKYEGLRPAQRDLSLLDFYQKQKNHIISPIDFDKQIQRPPITAGHNLSEERFGKFNNMPKNSSKYKNLATPNFSKTSTKSTIDTFFGINPNQQENAQNQIYKPNYEYFYNTAASNTVNFKRFVSREHRLQLELDNNLPKHAYDSEKIVGAFDNLSQYRRTQKLPKFSQIPGRDDKLLYPLAAANLAQNNIDNQFDYSMSSQNFYNSNASFTNNIKRVKVPQSVKAEDFLPNSIKSSPAKRDFSHSATTHKLMLRKNNGFLLGRQKFNNAISSYDQESNKTTLNYDGNNNRSQLDIRQMHEELFPIKNNYAMLNNQSGFL